VAEYATEFPPDSPQMRGFLKLLLEHHTALDPTMNVFEAMFTSRPGRDSTGSTPRRQTGCRHRCGAD